MSMFISIDVGGTNTRVAGAKSLENPVYVSEPMRRKNSRVFENDLAFMIDAAQEIAGNEQVEAVGIGVPGALNEDRTGIEIAKNLSSWAQQPLTPLLSKALGNCSVFLAGDVVAAGLGESYYRPMDDNFDYIVWGTGVGGAGVEYVDGQPTASVLNWSEYFGEWDADLGGAGLTRQFGKAPENFTDADWEIVATDFRQHLTNYLEMRKPQSVIFGGGLAMRHSKMIQEIGKTSVASIDLSKFGDNAGLVGGLGLIRSNLEHS